jgi:hypothetical protein
MSTALPQAAQIWRKLPSDRRQRLIVLIGRLALRRLSATAPVEAHHDPRNTTPPRDDGQDPGSSS